MTHNYTVFVSYSWKKTDYRTLLIEELNRINDIEIFCDHLDIPSGAELWSKISDGLDRCDTIVTILSEDALKSLEVRDELTRAHDRGKPIIPIVETKEADARMSTITPHFLRTTLQISFVSGKFAEKLQEIKSVIESKRDAFNNSGRREHLLKSFAKLRKLVTDHNDLLDVSSLLMKNIINSGISEITQIRSLQYDVDLGREHDFLLRAGPLFASANEIYAVTLAWISDFWTDKNNLLNAIEYLQKQNPSTIRIID